MWTSARFAISNLVLVLAVGLLLFLIDHGFSSFC